MFSSEMRIEIERRVIQALDERAKAGLPTVNLDSLRAIVRADLDREIETKHQASVRPLVTSVPPAPPRPVTPTPTRVAPKPAPALPKPVAAAPSPILLAERARAQRIIAMTPKGAEAECETAVRAGTSVAEFEGVLAAWMIRDATRRASGR